LQCAFITPCAARAPYGETPNLGGGRSLRNAANMAVQKKLLAPGMVIPGDRTIRETKSHHRHPEFCLVSCTRETSTDNDCQKLARGMERGIFFCTCGRRFLRYNRMPAGHTKGYRLRFFKLRIMLMGKVDYPLIEAILPGRPMGKLGMGPSFIRFDRVAVFTDNRPPVRKCASIFPK